MMPFSTTGFITNSIADGDSTRYNTVMIKVLGIDYGARRVGIALSDDTGTLAFAKKVLVNDKNLLDNVTSICIDKKVTAIVIGESKDFHGDNNEIAKHAKEFANQLTKTTDLPIHFENEFLTSSEARRIGSSSEDLDAHAAAFILQRYLDRPRKEKKLTMEERTRAWMQTHADSNLAIILLSFIAFAESSFLPLPPSAFMLGMIALGDRKRWIQLATLTTLMSVAGGLFGYLVGAVFYDTLGIFIIDQYHLADEITYFGGLFAERALLANFIGAFTPIPYKAFTIASGFFAIPLAPFIIASVIGRGLRFFIVGYLAKVFGEHVARSVFRYFTIITLIAIAIILLIVVIASL